jgi:diaminohydroxyphosphoribosylaminopyrimidine deaminase/5-amino-6-(5-phosphoribosylamino)uracil reductase
MRAAIQLAARGRGRTAPNPCVGAVVVRGERVLARARTADGGAPHAEARALARAGAAARGATIYVTLEPCANFGRTPPCVDAVIAARPRRVVIGMVDPDPRTAGSGIRRLRRAGIEVEVGVEADACARLHEGFLSRILRGRPFTTLKLAASLDGRIATRTGESRWLTDEPARARSPPARGLDAVAVGSNTMLARPGADRAPRRRVVHHPVRIAVDPRLRNPAERGSVGALVLSRPAPGAAAAAPGARAPRWFNPHPRGATSTSRLARLGSAGVGDLLVEGGEGAGGGAPGRRPGGSLTTSSPCS